MARALARRQLKRRLEAAAYRLLRLLVSWAFRRRQPHPAPRRFLLVLRGQRYGDAVVSLAFSAALRQRFPEAVIWALGPPMLQAVLACDRNLAGFLPLPDPEWRHPVETLRGLLRVRRLGADLAFALGIHFRTCLLARLAAGYGIGYDYNGRGFVLDQALAPHLSCNRSGWEYDAGSNPPHITRFWARLLDQPMVAESEPSWTGLDLGPHQARAAAFLAEHLPGPSPLVLVHPWASSAIRTWPAHHLQELLSRAAAGTDWRLVVSGGPEHAARAAELVELAPGRLAAAAGRLTLAETWALLRQASAVVSVDTVVIHMAAAVNVPVISLFGPGDPLVWGPWGQLDRVLQPHAQCRRCKRATCLHPGLPCMEAIQPELVLERVRALIAGCG